MRVRYVVLIGFLAVAAQAFPAGAQDYFPETIRFTGTNLPQQQLLAFTGLKPGKVTKDEMQAASDRLQATGLFLEVHYELDDDLLVYTLKPSPGVLPVHYDNFPWWDTATLNALVAKTVPLYDGALYPGGPMKQQVLDALTTLLAEKGITAKISAIPVGNAKTTMIATNFHIDSPKILISSFVVEGASDAWAAAIRRVEELAVSKEFSRASPDALAAAVRDVYAQRGYLDAVVTPPVWGAPKLADGKYMVPLTATIVSEGQPYRVSSVRFAGNAMTTAAEFAAQAKIHAGDVADADLVQQTGELLTAAWKAKGYAQATVDAGPVLDRAAHTVAYTFSVDPGRIYTMGNLTLVGLNARQERLVWTYWQLPKGAVFQPGLVPRWREAYLNERGDQLMVGDKLKPMVPVYHYQQQEETRTVDVTVTFTQKPVANIGDYHPSWH